MLFHLYYNMNWKRVLFFITKKDIDNYPYSIDLPEDVIASFYKFLREKELFLRAIFLKFILYLFLLISL